MLQKIGGNKMVRIKGWKKLVDKKGREYWENEERDMIANVEKIGSKWYFTKIGKNNQESTIYNNYKEAKSRAIKYMRFHS